MAAFVELSPGDSLVIGKSIIKMERKGGGRARLAVDTAENIEHIRADDKSDADPQQATPNLRRPKPA